MTIGVRPSRRAVARQLLIAGAAGVAWACAAPSQAGGQAADAPGAAPAADVQQILLIDHVAPRRDFVGPLPDTFIWTAAPGVDRYAIGVWDEVDRLLWRQDGLTTTSVARPKALVLEPGTYFWSVSGQQQGREIARSGQSPFVVE